MVLTLHRTLAPIGARVEWAKKHITELQSHVETFLASKPYKIETKPDPDRPNWHKYFVASINSEPPISISLMAGDVLFNLRAALDHLAYQLAVANGTTDKRILRDTSFPIFDSAEQYAEYSRRRMAGMSQDAIHAIDDVKPYKGGNDLLWQLHKLNNIDKHRILVTVGSALGWHSVPIKVTQDFVDSMKDIHATASASDWEEVMGKHDPSEIRELNVRPAMRKCPLQQGDELTLAFADPALHQNSDLTFSFEIAFSEAGIIHSEPVVGVLMEMANAIDLIIMEFKPLLPA